MAGTPNNPMILVGGPSFRVEFPDHTSELRRPRDSHDDTIIAIFKATFTLPRPNDQHAVRCHRAFSVPLHELTGLFRAEDIAERMLAAAHAPAVSVLVGGIVNAARALMFQTENLSEWNPRIAFHLGFVVRELPNIPEPHDDGIVRARHYDELFDEGRFLPVNYAYANYNPFFGDEEDPLNFVFSAFSLGVRPASKESIEGLEKVMIKEVSEDETLILSCSICLEDISVGSVATRLPCSHYFHGNCIAKWLGTSKFCPLCRFEMPS